MKPFIPSRWFAFMLMATATAAATPADSKLRFSNNDVLTGMPLAIQPDTLLWKSPLLEQPAPFFTDKLLDVTLPASVPESQADHQAIVSLTNGDSVRGKLLSVTDETVSLDTWFAGRLDFNRLMVSGVKIEPNTAFVYRGPTSLDGWVQSANPPAWSYRQSAFRSSASGGIARDNLLPEECSVSFDAAWKGDSVRLRVILFSDDPTSDNPESGYEVSFQRGSVQLRNFRTQNFLGSTQAQALMMNDRVNIEIRASAKTNRIAVFINDRILEVWNDPDAAKIRPGTALHFIAAASSPHRISNLRVAQWDGVIDQMPEPRPGIRQQFRLDDSPEMPTRPSAPSDPAANQNRMELANGDSISGEVTTIHDGIITINTPLGEVRLPVSRLRSVALKPVEPERCKRYKGDVRGWLPDGSSIVFRLDASDGDTLTGFSQNFGTADFRTTAFSRIEFNIHSPVHDQTRGTDDW